MDLKTIQMAPTLVSKFVGMESILGNMNVTMEMYSLKMGNLTINKILF